MNQTEAEIHTDTGDTVVKEPRRGLTSSGELSSSCRRLTLTLVELMSIITSWKAAVSSACRWVCSAIFSLNFRGLEAPDPVPELGPGPGPPEPVADMFTKRTGRLDGMRSLERGGKRRRLTLSFNLRTVFCQSLLQNFQQL